MKNYTPKMTHALGLTIASDLINGATDSAFRFLEQEPLRALSKGTWENVVSKLVNVAREPQAAFSIFTAGNGKLPFVCFSSMAILDCPGAGECAGWCYSKQAWRQPNAWGRQVSNSILLRSEAGRGLIRQAFLALPDGIAVRLYVDGDFASVEILRFWMDLIHERPDLKVYGYSKSWVEFIQLHLSGYVWPKNYTLNLSGGSKHGERMLEIMRDHPVVRGEFIAVPVERHHMRIGAYQSKRHEGHAAYAKNVRESAGKRVFVCPGKCGDCLPDGSHACGSSRMNGVTIAIGVH